MFARACLLSLFLSLIPTGCSAPCLCLCLGSSASPLMHAATTASRAPPATSTCPHARDDERTGCRTCARGSARAGRRRRRRPARHLLCSCAPPKTCSTAAAATGYPVIQHRTCTVQYIVTGSSSCALLQLFYSDVESDTSVRVEYATAAARCRDAGGVLTSIVDDRLNSRLSQVFGCAAHSLISCA